MPFLGLDIGGTQIKACLFSPPEKITLTFETPSNANRGPEGIRSAATEIARYFKDSEFSKIGVGCAGSVDHANGVVRNSPNFGNWKNVCLADLIESIFEKPVVVENDANCAMYAEWKTGNAKGCKNAVLLTFGTGIGGGLILNNQLYRGSTGSAAELGHFSIQSDGIVCPCGHTGCFERYCSASALLQKHPNRSVAEIFRDPTYRESVTAFIHWVQIGMTSIANVFDPDKILIGGGVGPGVLAHLEEIRSWVKTHAFPAVAENVWIGPAHHENWSGALGAALIAAQS